MIGAPAPRPWPGDARVCDAVEAIALLQENWRVIGRTSCVFGCVATDGTCYACAWRCPPWLYVLAPPPGPVARALRDVVDLAGRWLRPNPAVPL